MKIPSQFFKSSTIGAIGAPKPIHELPIKLERIIHFFPLQEE